MFSDKDVDRALIANRIEVLVRACCPDARPEGASVRAACPICGVKAFYCWPETNTFRCFECETGGGPIQFVMETEDVDFGDAVRRLQPR